MLTINREQLSALERVLLERSYENIQAAVEAACPEACALPPNEGEGDRALGAKRPGRKIVERGLYNAAKFGIDDDADVAAFIVLGLALRSNSNSKPVPDWIVAWLQRPETSGNTKMAVIETQLASFGASDPELARVAAKVDTARNCIQERAIARAEPIR
jgi:hypothetical protein